MVWFPVKGLKFKSQVLELEQLALGCLITYTDILSRYRDAGGANDHCTLNTNLAKNFKNITVFFKPLTVEEPTTFQTEVGFEPTTFASTNHFPSTTFSIEPASSTFCTAQVALSSSLVSEGIAISDSQNFQDIFARLTKQFITTVTIGVAEIWVFLICRPSQGAGL